MIGWLLRFFTVLDQIARLPAGIKLFLPIVPVIPRLVHRGRHVVAGLDLLLGEGLPPGSSIGQTHAFLQSPAFRAFLDTYHLGEPEISHRFRTVSSAELRHALRHDWQSLTSPDGKVLFVSMASPHDVPIQLLVLRFVYDARHHLIRCDRHWVTQGFARAQ